MDGLPHQASAPNAAQAGWSRLAPAADQQAGQRGTGTSSPEQDRRWAGDNTPLPWREPAPAESAEFQ